MQEAAPALLNWPHGHGSSAPVPSQYDPAGHTSHAVRVGGELPSPPEVYEPELQVLQLVAAAPPWLKLPPPQDSCALPPGHAKPAGQTVHAVRVSLVAPVVNDPDGHVLQLLAPAALYLLFSPHAGWVLPLLPPGQ